MAIRALCEHCKKSFSAPEEYRGHKVKCPGCGRRFLLRSEEDVREKVDEVQTLQKREEEDREKLALIERMDSRSHRRGGRPYYEEFQTGQEGVRHYQPRSPSRFGRFRTLSDFLVLGAYIELLLASVGIGLSIYLKISGAIGSIVVLFVAIVAWVLFGLAFFLFFKCLGELAFLIADVADLESDTVHLLLDLRDNTEDRTA